MAGLSHHLELGGGQQVYLYALQPRAVIFSWYDRPEVGRGRTRNRRLGHGPTDQTTDQCPLPKKPCLIQTLIQRRARRCYLFVTPYPVRIHPYRGGSPRSERRTVTELGPKENYKASATMRSRRSAPGFETVRWSTPS